MNKRVSRRQFLGTMAATGAATAIATPAGAQTHSLGRHGDQRVERVASNCEMCFWRCGILASVADGKVVRVEGNPDHPLTKGRLCARGNAGADLLYDPDRLKYPMLRKGGKKSPLERVSWDEALTFLTDRLTAIKTQYGPEAVAYFPHGVAGSLMHTVMKAFGTPNTGMPSFAQCRGPRDVGFQLTYGQGLGSPEPLDLGASKLVVLIGSHLGENVFTSQVTQFADALAGGAKLIAVDPRFSTAASKADWWLPIRPSTDIALLLAWSHVLITEELYDKDYVAKYAVGLDQLAAHVKDTTPEWAAPITDLTADVIRETARAMGAAKPAVLIHPGRHTTWYGDDTQRTRAMAIVTALLGSYGRKGGINLPTPIPAGSFKVPPFPKPAKGRADGAGDRFPFASQEEGVTNGIVEATISGQPYPIKAWMTWGQNVLESIPQPQLTRKAIDGLDLFVVVDVLPVEQVELADLVLPECTYLERYDPPLIAGGVKEPFISVRFPAVDPLYESKPGWWIAKSIADRLGLGAYLPWATPEEHLATIIEPMGISMLELRNRGAIAFPGRPYIEDRIADGTPFTFKTPSGKIELYSEALAKIGQDPLPRYVEHEKPPDGWFRLIYGRAPMHSFGRSENNATLNGLMSENEVWLHTGPAAQLGLKSGDRVALENRDGVRSEPVLVKVTEGIRTDAAYLVHGFGHRGKGLSRAYRKGISDTSLMSRVTIDPLMGGTGMRVNFVRPVKG
jgi:thiosulfate reductase / polysulfide reductase chain A